METMNKLTRGDLLSLEKYVRGAARVPCRVMAHKRNRQPADRAECHVVFRRRADDAPPGPGNAARRADFRGGGIQEELDAYNPLIPDGSNWKATFMMEYPDEERSGSWRKLLGIEKHIWVQVADFARVTPIADEDLEARDRGQDLVGAFSACVRTDA